MTCTTITLRREKRRRINYIKSMPQSAKEALMFGRSYKGGQGALYSSVNFGFDTKDELKIS